MANTSRIIPRTSACSRNRRRTVRRRQPTQVHLDLHGTRVVSSAIAVKRLMRTFAGRRSRFIFIEGKLAEILAAYGKHLERAEPKFFVMLARRERVEIPIYF